MLAISCASSTRPPPLPRRSKTIPRAPWWRRCSTASRTSACAPGLKDASATTPSLTPCTTFIVDATTGSETTARVILIVRVAAVGALLGRAFDLERHGCPGQPLDQGDRRFIGHVADVAAVDGDDRFAGLQPGALRGRGVEDVGDQQAVVGRVDLHPDPREVRRRDEFAVFALVQVVGEAVVQARDDAGYRRIRELAGGDRPVVVAADPLDRFVDDAGLMVGHEGRAQEPRKVFRVAAQPQPGDEQHGQHQREDEGQRVSAGDWARLRARIVARSPIKRRKASG